MMDSVTVILVGGLMRMIQGFAQAAPTLLVGLMVASIMRYYLGPKGTRRLLGGDTLRSLPQSWLVGMLLPVCSIGVLPILFEMRRCKVKPGAMSAFAISAPLFNPLSLLYGLTLSRPMVIILFALGSLIVVTALGLFWDAASRKPSHNQAMDEAAPDHLIGLRRVYAALVHFAREATGVPLLITFVSLAGLAFLAAVLPFGAMQNSVERDDWWAPLKMMFVAVPVYATPMLAMSQMGMMFQHANSPGASFALLILGAGMNLATPLWFGRHYGWKSASAWFSSLLLIVLGLSYAINKPLVPQGVEPAGHTHAFDVYANPLSLAHTISFDHISEMMTKEMDIGVLASLIAFASVAILGLLFRVFKIDEASLVAGAETGSFASSLEAGSPTARRGLDVVVPAGVIGATMLAGLVAFSVVACYAYYPSPSECLEEIGVARAECLSAANSTQAEHALFWLPVWDDWSRRLEVGTFIRSGQIRPYQRMQGYLIRKKLELLEHELEHEPFEPEEARRVVADILKTNSRWVRSFRPER